MPSRDHVIHCLPCPAKAKIFSVIGAKDGFGQDNFFFVAAYAIRYCLGSRRIPKTRSRSNTDNILVYGCGYTEEAIIDHDAQLKQTNY